MTQDVTGKAAGTPKHGAEDAPLPRVPQAQILEFKLPRSRKSRTPKPKNAR